MTHARAVSDPGGESDMGRTYRGCGKVPFTCRNSSGRASRIGLRVSAGWPGSARHKVNCEAGVPSWEREACAEEMSHGGARGVRVRYTWMLRCCELTQAERDKRERSGKRGRERRGRELMVKESEVIWRGARGELREGGVPRG